MPTTVQRRALAEQLRRLEPGSIPSVTSGFDAFVDEMIRVVGERQSIDRFASVPTIAEFGKLISDSAGHSSLREMVITGIHPGGCTMNLGDGLASLGVPVDVFATMGQPPHPAFAPILKKLRSYQSWGDQPGRTLALEFDDGKFMLSALSQLAEFTPERVATLLKDGHYEKSVRASRLVALTNWSLYPHMTEVWRFLHAQIFRQLTHHPYFLLDLVDPASRSVADLQRLFEDLPLLESVGPVTLSLNWNEGRLLAQVFDQRIEKQPSLEGAISLAENLRERLHIAEVLIHFVKGTALSTGEGQFAVVPPYCAQPKKSTGAGDRFNAGYALGRMLDLPPENRLWVACGSAGIFVRQARSASREELAEFLCDPAWESSA